MDRTILHADMNNCYASIEQKLNPKLKNLPIAVCGSQKERHGIVLAKSQEAKAFGIKTGEAIWQARQKCPELVIVPPQYEEYLKHSLMARDIYYEYTNQVEPFGLDECWLDVTGSTHLFGNGKKIADELRRRFKTELGITISVGVSFNKTFAKLGSDLKKPDQTTVILREESSRIVDHLEVERLLGVGPKTKFKLNKIGIYTIGELKNTQASLLHSIFGIVGLRLKECAMGLEDEIVHDRDFRDPIKSIGRGATLKRDIFEDEEVKNTLFALAMKVSKKLKDYGLLAGGVHISIKDSNFKKTNVQRKFQIPTDSSLEFRDMAFKLYSENYKREVPIRYLGIRAIDLIDAKKGVQLGFFTDTKRFLKREAVDNTVYELRNRFGKIVNYAPLINEKLIPFTHSEIVTLPSAINR